MRMRKKAWAEPFLQEKSDFVIQCPESLRGRWKEKLGKEELHVEIGCGKGDYFTKMSIQYPDTAWIGIEKDLNVAAVSAKKSLEADGERRCMIAKDATSIEEWFIEGEIDVIHLNFSDPWHKSGYKKRRLSHKNFLDKYQNLLSKQGRVIMKTDNQALFEFSLKEFTGASWELEEVWVDFRKKDHPEDVITEYEQKFMDLGCPIYRAIFKKPI